jgi:VanZ family protein
MTVQPPRRAIVRGAALAAAMLVVLALTLAPGGARGPGDACAWCDEQAFADLLRNVLLFMPVGVLLVWNGWRPGPAMVTAALGSAGIEALQSLLPGRHPSLMDWSGNTAGAIGGILIARTAVFWWWPPRVRAWRLGTAGAAVAAVVWLGTPALLRPAFPHSIWFGQWTPPFGGYAHYGGRVTEVLLGDLRLPSDVLPRSEAVRAALLRGDTLRLRFIAGPPTDGIAPIFSIADAERRGILMIAASGDDLVLRYRTRAAAWRLDQPVLRVAGGLGAARPGMSQQLNVELGHDGMCVQASDWAECPRFGRARGWSVLGFPAGLAPGIPVVLDGVWAVLLVMPSCYWFACAIRRAR